MSFGYQAADDVTTPIRKGQFRLGKLRVENMTAPESWNAVLTA
jgi:hypothetical protein